MKTLQQRLKEANALLDPHAVPHEGKLGRVYEEPEDETRFPFQRDRDRIIHTQAFRRLQGKTQVFVTGEGDHYRTRLTHTMEVAQVSRDLARTLSLNEDLVECIALAHDLGHPPFGHAGEEALHEWMSSKGSSFEHNEQSLRIVTVLESHSSQYKGLNLNREILEGLRKHYALPTLEAQLVNIADEIAYTAHDCDDGLRERLFTLDDILTVPLARAAHQHTQKRGTPLRGGLIHLLSRDLCTSFSEQDVTFSPSMNDALSHLRTFLRKRMYAHPRVRTAVKQGKEILLNICESLYHIPPEKILSLQMGTGSTLEEAVKDFTAGMTDTFARRTWHELAKKKPQSTPQT